MIKILALVLSFAALPCGATYYNGRLMFELFDPKRSAVSVAFVWIVTWAGILWMVLWPLATFFWLVELAL